MYAVLVYTYENEYFCEWLPYLERHKQYAH